MRTPKFWQKNGMMAHLLSPFSYGWRAGAWLRRLGVEPYRASLPVLCVGNIVAGGAGKTPIVLDLLQRLQQRGETPWALIRGYGGTHAGPLMVDPVVHNFRDVGDEALLLATAAPTIVARDRAAGAKLAMKQGATILVLDDGLQNSGLVKTHCFLVMDGSYGLGNGRVIPAGPLRESMTSALTHSHTVIILGEDQHNLAALIGNQRDLLKARMTPALGHDSIAGQKVLAFAGIGRPSKFAATLSSLGAQVVGLREFPDHHPYKRKEIAQLLAEAAATQSRLITTTKDFVRLPSDLRHSILVLPITVTWENPQKIETLLDEVLKKTSTALGRSSATK
ncbi:MAG: tetraacyldisaccharide 4'-kinase [Alphaproteobacteria bacterium]